MSKVITHPKIAIRPTIDARENGVREALEEQTLKLANTLSEYIEANFKHVDGTAVKCIVPPFTIGRSIEAKQAEELFNKSEIAASITVTPCWCYGSETMDLHPTRQKAVWGFNGTERPGAVYLNAVMSAYNQMGLPVFGIYGENVQAADSTEIDADILKKVDQFVKAALATTQIAGKSYLQIGSVSMGIMGSMVYQPFFQKYLGMRSESVDMVEIIRRIEKGIYDQEEYEKALEWVKDNCQSNIDRNKPENKLSPEQVAKDWKFVVKMSLIIKDLMHGNTKLKAIGFNEEGLGHNAIAAGFQGQREWTDYLPNGDFSETILNTSFDWNGSKMPTTLATENDSLNAITMLFGQLLTNTSQIFCDVRTYWSPEAVNKLGKYPVLNEAKDGFIHLINSGSAALDGSGQMQDENGDNVLKPFWEVDDGDIKNCLDNTNWPVANLEYFRGGGFSTNFLTKPDIPFTMTRLALVNNKPILQIIEGYSLDVGVELYQKINERTDPTWPSTFFVPKESTAISTYEIMNRWSANHCNLTYGHVGDLYITLASMLRIPVSMHNVEAERIFRPSMWSHFGTESPQAADFMACSTLGPVYE